MDADRRRDPPASCLGEDAAGGAGVARDGRYRYTGPVVFTYLLVSVIHALWDYSHSIALALTFLLTGTPGQHELL